jgi:hypothetical protein
MTPAMNEPKNSGKGLPQWLSPNKSVEKPMANQALKVLGRISTRLGIPEIPKSKNPLNRNSQPVM